MESKFYDRFALDVAELITDVAALLSTLCL